MADTDSRPFGFWTATALVIGGMVGSGIFVLPAQLAPYGWTSIVAWFVAVGGSLVVAWVITRLAEAMPEAPGMIEICGKLLGPLVGVIMGWCYWVSIWTVNAIIAITAIRYLSVFVPALAATPFRLAISAIATVWLLTLLNLAGARAAGRFQVVTTVLKLLPLLAVVVILAGLAIAGGGQFSANAHLPFSTSALTPGLTLAFYALIGFEAASVAAERVRNPSRNVMLATLVGLSLTGALYIVVCCGIIFAMPQEVIANATAPMAMFVEIFWGPFAGMAVAGFAVIAAIGCMNGWILLQGEVPLGMARSGLLPRWIGRTNRHDVPVAMLVLSSVLTTILVLSNASGTASALLDFMLQLTTAVALWFYGGICVAALKIGLARVPAAVGLGFALWAMWGSGLQAVALSLILILTAVPLYFLRPATALAEQPA